MSTAVGLGDSGIVGYDVHASIDRGAWFQFVFGPADASTTFAASPVTPTPSTAPPGTTSATPRTPPQSPTPSSRLRTLPVLDAAGDRAVTGGQTVSFTATATDPDTGVFTWATTEADGPWAYTIAVRVTGDADPAGTDSETITVAVGEVNQAPVLNPIGNQTVNERTTPTFTAAAIGLDLPADALTFALVGAPTGATIDPSTGVFAWTPTEAPGAGS